MPALNRKPQRQELQRLIAAFLKAETDIINEIARLRTGGLVDYHAEAALERVQTILRRLVDESWTYVPRMIEREFYVQHPEARKPLDIPETAAKHASGYANAAALTGEQTDIVQRLTMNLIGEIDAAAATVTATLQNALIGRVEPDIFRRVGLEQVLAMEATGRGAYKELPKFVEALRREGITAFIDKAGRSEEELRKIKEFSSFRTNPPDRDPRTEKQIEAYRLKERGRAKWLADYRQFERYRLTIPDATPKTFAAFQRHKQADDEKYKAWEKAYREAWRTRS